MRARVCVCARSCLALLGRACGQFADGRVRVRNVLLAEKMSAEEVARSDVSAAAVRGVLLPNSRCRVEDAAHIYRSNKATKTTGDNRRCRVRIHAQRCCGHDELSMGVSCAILRAC